MAAAPPEDDIIATIERARHAHRRSVYSIDWCRFATEAWTVLNRFYLDGHIAGTTVDSAFATMKRGLLTERLASVTRTLDHYNPANPSHRQRLSLPFIRSVAREEACLARLEHEAETIWRVFDDGIGRDDVRPAFEIFSTHLDAVLADEQYVRVRNFRHDNVAHDLLHDDPRDPPLYRELRWLIDEVTALLEEASIFLNGVLLQWREEDVGDSMEALLNAVVERFSREGQHGLP